MTFINQERLLEWYKTVEPSKKVQLLLDWSIVKLEGQTFERRNQALRTIDEMPSQRRALIHRRDRECSYCGSQSDGANLQVDHIVPASAWPDRELWLAHTSSNLTSACESCNLEKSNKLVFSESRVYPIMKTCNDCNEAPDDCDTLRVWCARCNMNSFVNECVMNGMGHDNEL